MTPFQALYGINPSVLPAYTSGTVAVESVDELIKKREEVQQQLEINLNIAKATMKKYADLKRQK